MAYPIGRPHVHRYTLEQVLEKFKAAHGDKYDYSRIVYTTKTVPVTIICPIHGEFQQRPDSHWNGSGCAKCGDIRKSQSHIMSQEEFINKAKAIHGDRYDYSKALYQDTRTEVEIICPRHGSFFQQPQSHLYMKAGCPKCNYSRGEGIISYYLNNKNIEYETQYRFPDCKYKKTLRFDFYLPNLNTCIEYDGKQHFVYDDFYNSRSSVQDNQIKDRIKDEYCKNNNIKMIRIRYNDIEHIKDILDKELFYE